MVEEKINGDAFKTEVIHSVGMNALVMLSKIGEFNLIFLFNMPISMLVCFPFSCSTRVRGVALQF